MRKWACFFFAFLMFLKILIISGCGLSCVQYRGYFMLVILRIFSGSINVILGSILLLTVYRYASASHGHKRFRRVSFLLYRLYIKYLYFKANALTIIAGSTELLCNFTPNLIMLIIVWVHLKDPSEIFSYPIIMVSFDALITAISYRFVLTRKPNRVLNFHVTKYAHTNELPSKHGNFQSIKHLMRLSNPLVGQFEKKVNKF